LSAETKKSEEKTMSPMSRKIMIGILLGVAAGMIDIVPMIIQKLPIYAILSAFSMWVVLGFLINTSALKMNGALKGLLLSFLVILPTAILIAQTEPVSLIPIGIMTVILGALLGYASDKITKEKNT
jgi:hypothetical protein